MTDMKKTISCFDKALEEKNVEDIWKTGLKIARFYSFKWYKNWNLSADWENIATDVCINCLKVIENTKYKKENKYYFGVIRTGVKFRYLQLKNSLKILSLDNLCTNEEGKNMIDYLNFQPVESVRNPTEEMHLKICHEIIKLADERLSRKEVFEKINIDKNLFNQIIHKYGIQFYNDETREFIEIMKIYHIYKEFNEDMKKTRCYCKENMIKPPLGLKTTIDSSNYYLNMFQKNRKFFFNRFIYPPNYSSVFDKITGYN